MELIAKRLHEKMTRYNWIGFYLVDPADPNIRMATAGGITAANIMPGSGNVMGGQTAYVKLRGSTIEQMLIPGTIGGMKMANGTNPKGYGTRGQAPITRMGKVTSLSE